MKPKTCANPACGERFTPSRGFQSWCSPDCGIVILRQKEIKKHRAETRKRKQELNQNDRKWWINKAKEACHKYIRLRDKDKPCVCCPDVYVSAQWDAGHYRPAGNNSFLRFHEWNIHKQRSRPCNKDQSGNLTDYRIGLVNRIGIEAVEWLEGPHPTKKWTIDELKEVVERYKRKTKELESVYNP